MTTTQYTMHTTSLAPPTGGEWGPMLPLQALPSWTPMEKCRATRPGFAAVPHPLTWLKDGKESRLFTVLMIKGFFWHTLCLVPSLGPVC